MPKACTDDRYSNYLVRMSLYSRYIYACARLFHLLFSQLLHDNFGGQSKLRRFWMFSSVLKVINIKNTAILGIKNRMQRNHGFSYLYTSDSTATSACLHHDV
jgi:hypothetical protein